MSLSIAILYVVYRHFLRHSPDCLFESEVVTTGRFSRLPFQMCLPAVASTSDFSCSVPSGDRDSLKDDNVEARVGIEPASTALQAAA